MAIRKIVITNESLLENELFVRQAESVLTKYRKKDTLALQEMLYWIADTTEALRNFSEAVAILYPDLRRLHAEGMTWTDIFLSIGIDESYRPILMLMEQNIADPELTSSILRKLADVVMTKAKMETVLSTALNSPKMTLFIVIAALLPSYIYGMPMLEKFFKKASYGASQIQFHYPFQALIMAMSPVTKFFISVAYVVGLWYILYRLGWLEKIAQWMLSFIPQYKQGWKNMHRGLFYAGLALFVTATNANLDDYLRSFYPNVRLLEQLPFLTNEDIEFLQEINKRGLLITNTGALENTYRSAFLKAEAQIHRTTEIFGELFSAFIMIVTIIITTWLSIKVQSLFNFNMSAM